MDSKGEREVGRTRFQFKKKVLSLMGDQYSDYFSAKLFLQFPQTHTCLRIFNPNVIIGFDNQALVK